MKPLSHKLRQAWRAMPEWQRAALVTAPLLLALLPLSNRLPAFWRTAFVMPTAWIASWFMAADCIPTAQGCLLVTPLAPVHVTLACSAARFFVLLTSLLAGQILAARRAKASGLVLALLTAYSAAIAANATRVVCAWFAGRWTEHSLPTHFAAAVHLGAGIMVFLVFLILTWGWFMRYIITARRKE